MNNFKTANTSIATKQVTLLGNAEVMNLDFESHRSFIKRQSLKWILVNQVILCGLGQCYLHRIKKIIIINDKNIFLD